VEADAAAQTPCGRNLFNTEETRKPRRTRDNGLFDKRLRDLGFSALSVLKKHPANKIQTMAELVGHVLCLSPLDQAARFRGIGRVV
jgi:hypothetical protein